MLRLILAFIAALACHLGLFFLMPSLDDVEPLLGGEAISVSLSSADSSHLQKNIEDDNVVSEQVEEILENEEKKEERESVTEVEKSNVPVTEPVRLPDREQQPEEKVRSEIMEPIIAEPEIAALVSIQKDACKIKRTPGRAQQERVQRDTDNVGEAVPEPVKLPSPEQQPHAESVQTASAEKARTKSGESVNSSSGTLHAIVEAHPDYHQNAKPVYPKIARKRGWQGVVELDVRVAEDGSAERVTLHKSSGYAVLDKSAIKAARGWIFFPGKQNGRVVAMNVRVPVHFVLN